MKQLDLCLYIFIRFITKKINLANKVRKSILAEIQNQNTVSICKYCLEIYLYIYIYKLITLNCGLARCRFFSALQEFFFFRKTAGPDMHGRKDVLLRDVFFLQRRTHSFFW